jgi:beta-1,4-mannosyltransferase
MPVEGVSDTALTTVSTAASAKDASKHGVFLRSDRPAVIVSSTSWTDDEDFGILLDALVELDELTSRQPHEFPKFLVIVTGKGPQKQYYERKMSALNLHRVTIRTVWLTTQDYPLMLGSADLGVCLHVSTSGLDLPMKVVDMFGAGLPVCAVGFSCLSELVVHESNGLIFADSHELSRQLVTLFRGFPGEPSQARLEQLRKGVTHFQANRWHDNWMQNAAAQFQC